MTREQALQRCEELLAGWAGATPGPWRAYRNKLRPKFPTLITEVHGPVGKPIVKWAGFDGVIAGKAEVFANARLISCSPSLPVLVGWVRDELQRHERQLVYEDLISDGCPICSVCDTLNWPCRTVSSLCSLVEKIGGAE